MESMDSLYKARNALLAIEQAKKEKRAELLALELKLKVGDIDVENCRQAYRAHFIEWDRFGEPPECHVTDIVLEPQLAYRIMPMVEKQACKTLKITHDMWYNSSKPDSERIRDVRYNVYIDPRSLFKQ